MLRIYLTISVFFCVREVLLSEPSAPTRIGIVWLSTEGSDARADLMAKLCHVQKYFRDVSYHTIDLSYTNVYSLARVDGCEELRTAQAPDAERRRFIAAILDNEPATTSTPFVLVVAENAIWPYSVKYPVPTSPTLRAAAVITLDTDWGTVAHEVGHLLGLPDLYDHRLAAAGYHAAAQFGPWCLMSRSPKRPGLCGWSRLLLGWVPESRIVHVDKSSAKEVLLDSLSLKGTNALLIVVQVGRGRRYLVETRTRTDVDSCLPQDGVLITRINAFERSYFDRARLIDARPTSVSLDDAAFQPVAGLNSFYDQLHDVEVAIRRRSHGTYLVSVRNGTQ